MNFPNAITFGRILAAPLVTLLLFQPQPVARLLAFAVFVVAALSDLWDGHVARTRGQVTSFGKIADPLADKFLVLAAMIPLYLITRNQINSDPPVAFLPLFGGIPLWAVITLQAREGAVTLFRFIAARRGRVFPAQYLGKRRTFAQNVFVAAAIVWVAVNTTVGDAASGAVRQWLSACFGWMTTVFLIVALLLTIVTVVTYSTAFARILSDRHR